MKQMLLVKWEDNWADEMDLEGHFVIEKVEWEKISEDFSNHTEEIIYCVGTNEDIEYANGTEALAQFTTTEITEDEYQTLEKLDLLSSGFDGPDLEEWDD